MENDSYKKTRIWDTNFTNKYPGADLPTCLPAHNLSIYLMKGQIHKFLSKKNLVIISLTGQVTTCTYKQPPLIIGLHRLAFTGSPTHTNKKTSAVRAEAFKNVTCGLLVLPLDKRMWLFRPWFSLGLIFF